MKKNSGGMTPLDYAQSKQRPPPVVPNWGRAVGCPVVVSSHSFNYHPTAELTRLIIQLKIEVVTRENTCYNRYNLYTWLVVSNRIFIVHDSYIRGVIPTPLTKSIISYFSRWLIAPPTSTNQILTGMHFD